MPFLSQRFRTIIRKRALPISFGEFVMLISSPAFVGDLSAITDGQVVQITPGQWTGGIIVRELYRDDVLIAGSRGATSYTYNASTDAGHTVEIREFVSGLTATSPAILLGAPATPYYTFPFNTATTTMQPLDGFNGWDITPGVSVDPSLGVETDGIYAVADRVGQGFHIVDIGPHADYTVRYVCAGAPGGGDQGSLQRTVTFNIQGRQTFVSLTFGRYNWNVYGNVNFSGLPYIEGPPPSHLDNLVVEIKVKGNYFKLYFDGVLQQSSNLNGGLGVDITGTYTSGSNHVGLVQDAVVDTGGGPNPAYPFKLYKEFSVLPGVPATVNINNVVVNYVNGQQIPTITGITQGLTGNVEYLITKLDGTVVSPWAALGPITSNAFSGTGGAIPASAGGTSVRFYVRSASTPSVFAFNTQALLEYQAVLPLVKGMNEGFLANYSPIISNRNLVDRLDWRADGYTTLLTPGSPPAAGYITPESVGYGYDGIPHSLTHVGGDMRASVQDHVVPGDYTVTYPVGLQLAFSNAPSAVTITQAPANGIGKFSVDSTGKCTGFGFTTNAALPPEGFALTITKDGDPYPNLKASDQLIAWYKHAGVACTRHMTAKMVNGDHNVRVGASQVWKGTTDTGPVSVEFEVEVANRTNSDMWYNASHLMDDAALTAEFQYIEANLKPNLKCRIENSNETWNEAAAFTQHIDFKIAGLKKGYNKANAPFTPYNGVLHDFETDYSTFWPDTGTSRRAVLAGERIFAPKYGLGNLIWEAKQNIPANTETDATHGTPDLTYAVGPVDNAYWTVINNIQEIALAGKREVADRCRHVWALADTIFANPRQRTVRVLGGWHNGGTEYSKDQLRHNNLYQVVDEWATAPYWGGGLLNYGSPSTVPSFGDAQRDLAVTNTEAFFNTLFPAMSTTITQTVDLMATNKHEMARWLKSEFGLPINTIKLCSYECGVGEGVFGSWPDKQAIATLWPQILREPRMYDMQRQYLSEIAAKVGGVHCLFDRGGTIVPPTYDPGYFQLTAWQISWGESDIGANNSQYTGLASYPTITAPYTIIPGNGIPSVAALPQTTHLKIDFDPATLAPQADNTAISATLTDSKSGIQAVQPTVANQPVYVVNAVGTAPGIKGSGNQWLNVNAPGLYKSVVDTKNYTILDVVINTQPNGYGSSGGGSSDGSGFFPLCDGTLVGNYSGNSTKSNVPYNASAFSVVGYSSTTANKGGAASAGLTRVFVNGMCESSEVGDPRTGSNTTNFALLALNSTGTFAAKTTLVRRLVFDVELTLTEVLKWTLDLYKTYGVAHPLASVNVVAGIDGDSLSNGEAALYNASPMPLIAATNGYPRGTWFNAAIGGMSSQECINKASYEIDGVISAAGKPGVLLFQERANDTVLGRTAQQTYNNHVAYIAARRAANPTIKIIGQTPADWANGYSGTSPDSWNTLLVANYAAIGYNGIARVDLDPTIGSNSGVWNKYPESGPWSSPFADGVHFGTYAIQAALIAPLMATTFTMTQLPSAKRIYQRTTMTGGSQSKGTGPIGVSVNVTSIGTPYFRTRASDGTTILQPSTRLAAFTATGAQTLIVKGVDARLGWFYVDLSADGVTWQNGTTLVGMGANVIINGQSLASRMLVAASDNISMTAAGVTPDPNTSTYVIPGDGSNAATTAAWRPWDATTAGNVGGEVINSAGGAQLAKSMVAQLGVNVGTIGHPQGGTPIVQHTMAGGNGVSIRQIIQDCGGFELSFLMIGHSNAAALTTGGVGARDFKAGLSAHFQLLSGANPLGINYRTVVWAIPNETSGGTWGTSTQQNEIRRAMYEFAQSTTASSLMTSCKYVNSYGITLSGDGVHEGQAGAIQIADIVTNAFSTGLNAPAGDNTLAATPVSVGTATSATYGVAGKFEAAALNGGYIVTQNPYGSAGIGTVGFWYKGTPAASSVPFSWGNEYVQENGGRWTWHQGSGTETTATTGPTTGTDSTTWHYVSVDRVFAAPNGSGGYLTIYQDGIPVLSLSASALNTPASPGGSAIRTFAGSPGAFGVGVPISDWRGYTKAMGPYVPSTPLSANEPYLFVGFKLNGDAIAVA